MHIEQIAITDLTGYQRNSRTHSAEQVRQIAASITEFGFCNPVLIDNNNEIIAGHGRLEAAKHLDLVAVPCIRLGHLTDTQKRAYVIADNKLAENAGWDADLLALELADLKELDFDLGLLGFDADALADYLPEPTTEGLTDPDDIPETPPEPITQRGDIWQLGPHRLMCGDSTSAADVARLMDGKTAALLHADPPYGMGKQKDGVENDNLYRDKLDSFQMQWWHAFRSSLDNNASAYIWGNAPDLWRLWYVGGLAESERMTMRNEIVWNKIYSECGRSDAMGQGSELRSFAVATERALLFMLGEQGFNTNADNYWEGFEPFREYLDGERKKMGWSNKDVAAFFGFHPRMADHWFSKSQWSFPKKEQYERLQAEAKAAFKRDYDALKRDFYATRAYFDNTHDNMTDVWEFARVTGEERHGHATPKPVAMMQRVMKSSLPPGGLCVEPFSGSGSTLMGAESTARICYAMEITPAYVDVAVKRWENFTGQKAKRVTP